MDLGLAGKVAMVAGASRGLGFAVAQGLAAERAQVSMVSRDESAIASAAERIHSVTGLRPLAMACDVRSAAAISAWREATLDHLGGVDLLFVNTGGPPAGTFGKSDDTMWTAGFELLLLSAIRMVREAVSPMAERGGGSIVLATSSSVKQPIPNLAVSTVFRASVASLAKILADEYAVAGIRVNHLIPGRIDTDRVRELDQLNADRAGIAVEEHRSRSIANIPLGRYGEPEEFGRAAVFLLSNAASYITGATLQVDGGLIRSVL